MPMSLPELAAAGMMDAGWADALAPVAPDITALGARLRAGRAELCKRGDARGDVAGVAAQEAPGADRRHARAPVLVAPIGLAHGLPGPVERVVAHEPRRPRSARQDECGEAAPRAPGLDRIAIGEQLALRLLAVLRGRRGTRRPDDALDLASQAPQALRLLERALNTGLGPDDVAVGR